MSDTLLGSASGLHRVLVCPASRMLPQAPKPVAWVEKAEQGKRRHLFAEHAPDGREAALAMLEVEKDRKYCARIDVTELAGYRAPKELREVKWAYDAETGSARFIKGEGERAYGDLKDSEIPGTADVVHVGHGVVEVWDYKFGKHPVSAKDNPQNTLHAVCATELLAPNAKYVLSGIQHYRGYGRCEPNDHLMDRLDLEMFSQKAVKALKVAREARAAIDAGEDPPVNPTEGGCRFCLAKSSCPAMRGR